MTWIKSHISATPEGSEIIFGILLSLGISGAEIIDNSPIQDNIKSCEFSWDYVDEGLYGSDGSRSGVLFYLPDNSESKNLLFMLREKLILLPTLSPDIQLGELSLHTELVDDSTWLDEWKKHYKPFRIGKSIVVVPEWEDYQALDGDVVFKIDPGSAFGTGLHQTTRLCVHALENYICPGYIVADIGCGSGILSIVSLLLGAESAFACDIDPVAVLSTRKNAELNGVCTLDDNTLTLMPGDILSDYSLRLSIKKTSYDIVLANIVAAAVINITPFAKEILKPSGHFIASGIIDEHVNEVLNVFEKNGFHCVSMTEQDGWHCFIGALNHA